MTTQHAQQHSANPKFPIIYVMGGALWFGLTAVCWSFGQRSNDWAMVGAVFCFCIGVGQFFKARSLYEVKRRNKSMMEASAQTAGQHGTSMWASAKQIKKAGMLKPSGLFLGEAHGKDIYYPGETHVLSIAPPGAGKGVCLAVPNLLSVKNSMIVTDPKGELYCMTHRFRQEKLGHKIIVLCPWAEKLSAELGITIPDHGFNPHSILRDGPDIKDDAELLSSLLLPGKQGTSASEDFWRDGGQSAITQFTLFLKHKYGDLDLPMLRRELMASPEELFGTLIEMSECDAFDGAMREMGAKMLGTLKNAPQQFEGAMGNAQKALRIYDPVSPMAQHVSSGSIDFAAIKDQPTTIYLIMPSDRSHTHAAWLNMVISLAIEMVGRDRSNRRVTFLLDEFANLGYLPNILRGMAQYRGQGVQVFAIIQQISQLERLYGKEGLREFLGMSEVINAFGVWEPDTLRLLSDLMGQRTLRQFNQHVTPTQDHGNFGFNYNASDHGAPLMRPEDIRTMPSGEQLIFYRNLPPIRAGKVSYLKRRSWRMRTDPNPYYRKSL